MNIPFPPEELARRRTAVAAALARHGLDGLLCFWPESRFWLGGDEPATGFECLLVDAAGTATLLTREPDFPESEPAPLTDERRYWRDGADVDPIAELRALLEVRGLADAHLGIEYAGLAGADARRLDTLVDEPGQLEDASDLVTRERAVKSPGEMACIRRAVGLADDAVDAALASAAPGAWEGEVAAAVAGAILNGGGSLASDIRVRACGPDATIRAGRRHLGRGDELALEWAAAYRGYRAPVARILAVGMPDPAPASGLGELHALAAEAMAAAVETCCPGTAAGAIYDAQAGVIEAAAGTVRRAGTCGHGLGATFNSSADWPILHSGNEAVIASGMALLLRIALEDAATGRGVVLGRVVEITDAGAVPLQRHGTDLLEV